MDRYRDNPAAIAALVRDTEVHKDCYIDPEVFALEMQHLFANTWVYVGHASQVPKPGDYFATTVGDQPVVMVRHTDQSIKVLYNRCAHKGVKVAPDGCGSTGKFFRCPYHAWTYRTDGKLLSIPLKKGYENTGFEAARPAPAWPPSARCIPTATSSSAGSTPRASASRTSSAPRSRRWTTWSTARPRAGWKWPAA